MVNSQDFGSSKRRVDTELTEVPPKSPLADEYQYILWSIISEQSDKFRCLIPECNDKSWMAVQRNPIMLIKRDSVTHVDINSLSDEARSFVDLIRENVKAVCKKHALEKYADLLIDNGEK
jgi:hypothetical protein